MIENISERPDQSEYASYYEQYVSLVPETDYVQASAKQLTDTFALLRSIPEESGDKSYEPGKWSIKELIGHMLDTERVFVYRAFNFARGCALPLPGFDQDAFAKVANYSGYKLSDLIDEYEHLRKGNLSLFRHLKKEDWSREGVASDCKFTARAVAFIILGHERHHLNVLKARYL